MDRFSTSLLGEASTLLLATDGSDYSDGAIQEAIFFGQACRARVIVLHVIPTQVESIGAARFAIRQGQQELAPHLEQIRAMALDSGVDIEAVVIGANAPEQAIVEQARLRGADVILMGRHGWAGRLSLLMGKMTARVIGQGFPRVLVAPKDFIVTGRRLLVAVDDSANGQQAAREGLSLARACATLEQLTVLSVARKEADQPHHHGLAEAVCAQAAQEGVTIACTPLAPVGDPATCVVAAALEGEADMVIIGAWGRGSVAGLLHGHVCEQVVGRAHCAVLVVTA
ncbi:MAG: universal stress protein [Desulfobulbus sp.]|jgi:nucleotide-binding universal stress UspA family protein|nr:universal stress protein [Desulfobulbus sp.]